MTTLMNKSEWQNALLDFQLCKTVAQKAAWADKHAEELIEQLDLHDHATAEALIGEEDCEDCEKAISQAQNYGADVSAYAANIRSKLNDLEGIVVPKLLPFEDVTGLERVGKELEELEE